jgi:ribosomal protein S18 acetylase RimI-like enzyme
MAIEWSRDGFEVSDDPARLDLPAIHRFISGESYWAEGISEALLARAIANSLCLGLYRGSLQAGFARVVTDRATYGYLCDVYVERAHRGCGLGKWLVACVLEHPDLQGLRRIALMTRDAHDLYRPFGFRTLPEATRYLEIHRPDVYKAKEEAPA